jgi:hypothetical protein
MSSVFNHLVNKCPIYAKRTIPEFCYRYCVALVWDNWQVCGGVNLSSAVLRGELVHGDFVRGVLVYLRKVTAEQIAHECKLIFKDCFQELMISTVEVVKDPVVEER